MPRSTVPIEVRATPRQFLGMPTARFLRDYWQKRPLLIRNAFANFQPPLTPDDLAGLACMDGALARIVLHEHKNAAPSSRPGNGLNPDPGKGKWHVRSGPFDDATFASLPDSHWTLLVQDVDKWDADTAALLAAFAFIPSWRIDDVMISYAADRGGVGAHVDQYDVFLLQGFGQRRWAIDASSNPPTEFRADAELKLLKAFSPTHEWVLEPGDMLYLPPGVPHDGVAVGECMTFSIGMRAPAAAEMLVDFAHSFAERLPEAQRYADPDLQVVREDGEIDDTAMTRALRAMPWLHVGTGRYPQARAGGVDSFARSVSASLFRTWFGCFITRYRVAQSPVPRKRRIDRAALKRRLPDAMLERDPYSRFAWCRNGRDATLFVAGQAYPAPSAWARTLAGRARAIDGRRLAELPRQADGLALLATLIDAGYLRLRHGS